MASNEEKQLKIEVDVSAIELAEEAMGRLDKLLEQTQRRAAALGRISVAPFILLEHRATTALDRIERSLMRLNRTRVYPTVTLIDQVTAGIEQIRASMLSLTANPWRLSVEGVKWDEVVGDTFFQWIDGEGQERLMQMSTKLGESLGNGIRESMMNSLGINGDPNQSVLLPISPFESLLVPKNETVFEEAGRIAGEQFRYAFLQAVGDMLSINLFDGGGLNGEPTRTFSGSRGSFKEDSGTVEWIRQFAVDNVLEGGEQISTDILDKKLAGYVSDLNIPPSAKKALGLMKTGFIIDLVTILAAEPGKERYEAIGGALGSASIGFIGTAVGGPLVGVPAAVLGGYGGEEIGGWIYDTSMMSDEERKQSRYAAERLGGWYPDFHAEEMLKEKPLGLYSTPKINIKPDVSIPRTQHDLDIPFDPDWWKTYYFSNRSEVPTNRDFSLNNYPIPQASETPVQITLSPGTVNLTVQKEEINYDQIANVSARKIANEIRLAMQNVQ
ncbi:hypothetical protein [Paenibacillus antibioticophila]|uniref:hypothetical protein n=1 Tax=Paenibacillus antibioticophila TaxID=1274374 RepID=UPI0005C7EA82|nr:hypothetical protein [Paenibacillus antibioticophila]